MAKRPAPKKRAKAAPPLSPAQKGWATRRANEQRRAEEAALERRRAAARRGVETRRANAAKAKRAEAARKGWETRRRNEQRGLSNYERRDANARAKGYDSYWDERQSRVRAKEAYADMGITSPSVAQLDALGTLGRGGSARDLYHAARTVLERYEGPSTDAEVWALIRVFYKSRKGHR